MNGSSADTLTWKAPAPATLNSMKSSYCSNRIGRNVTSTVAESPGWIFIVSGNSISKYLVCGRRYLTLSAFLPTFLSVTVRT